MLYQRAPRICLSLPPQCWDYKCGFWGFTLGLHGSEASSFPLNSLQSLAPGVSISWESAKRGPDPGHTWQQVVEKVCLHLTICLENIASLGFYRLAAYWKISLCKWNQHSLNSLRDLVSKIAWIFCWVLQQGALWVFQHQGRKQLTTEIALQRGSILGNCASLERK